jgi:NAD(P)-dependent dehydrogenase (short-subunit alcohol dehydrogenase family)
MIPADICQDFKKTMDINSTGTFIIDACVADAINSQYPDEGDFPPRTTDERGIIINIASVVGWPVPARCLTYGVSKSKPCLYQFGKCADEFSRCLGYHLWCG